MNHELLREVLRIDQELCGREMAGMGGVNLIDFSIMLAVHGSRQRQMEMLRHATIADYAIMVQAVGLRLRLKVKAERLVALLLAPPAYRDKSGIRHDLLILVGGATLPSQSEALTGQRPDNVNGGTA